MSVQTPSPATPRTNGQPAAAKAPPLPADAGEAPAAGLCDLTAFSDDALKNLVTAAQEEIAQRQARREAEFLAMVASTAKTLGLTPARIAAAIANKAQRQRPAAGSDGRSMVRPKYKNPNGPDTWSGRGAPPKWFADCLAAGITKEAMRIPQGQE